MKKISFILLLISSFTFGQFTVTENSQDWKEIGKYIQALKLYQNSDKTKAKIWYIDFNSVISTNVLSPTMDYEFEFSTDSDTLENLYNLIKKTLEEKQEKTLTLDFPEGQMKLNFFKSFGSFYVNFHFKNNSNILDKNSTSKRETYALNLKRLDGLFGKNK